MIQRVLKVERRSVEEPEYGYLEPRTVTCQDLILVKLIDGHRVSHTVVDTEIVPEAVIIELGCLGFTNWKSKWATVYPEAYVRTNCQ